jgi:hypothetical protein
VDDVRTTGSTLAEAEALLKGLGAAKVVPAVLATADDRISQVSFENEVATPSDHGRGSGEGSCQKEGCPPGYGRGNMPVDKGAGFGTIIDPTRPMQETPVSL